MAKEIKLTFLPDGTVKKETSGFVGKECITKTKFVEDALGTAGERRFKDEYYDEGQKESNSKVSW
jgi:hypothetical protein